MPAPDARTRCVLVAPRGDCRRARDLIERYGWIAHETGDLLSAMAELCLLDRTRAARRAQRNEPAEPVALLVAEPAVWPELAELLSAARRYVPEAALWLFDGEALRPANGPTDPPGELPPRPDVPPMEITAEEIDMLLDRPGEETDP